jgi:hypothetical protein
MHFPLVATILVFCATANAANAAKVGDPLKSPECLAALDALQALETTMAPKPSASSVREPAASRQETKLETARRAAAHACLGVREDAPPPRRAENPPVVVPARPAPALPSPPAPATAATLPPIVIPPTKTVTACDAAGCWANDGTRLQRAGDSLIGPKGLCTMSGSVLNCP